MQYCKSSFYSAYNNNPRKEQFKENFEDSEANYSEAEQKMGESSGRPIQLIKIERNGRITIGVEAL